MASPRTKSATQSSSTTTNTTLLTPMTDTIIKKELHIEPPQAIVKSAVAVLIMLALFLLVYTIGGVQKLRYIGAGIAPTNTISVSGMGEVFAKPDTGEFSFTVNEMGKDVSEAQEKSTTKSNDIVAYLKGEHISEDDIKTTDYSVNPRYEYSREICAADGYCPPAKQTIIGYEVSQTITVKVRDTQKAGTLLSGVGSRGVSYVSGLSFTVADEDVLKAQARDKAIAQAKDKAEALARSLGVSVVRVVSFNEDTYGGPILYGKAERSMVAMDVATPAVAPAPEVPVGQNKVTSNVTVTYEIR